MSHVLHVNFKRDGGKAFFFPLQTTKGKKLELRRVEGGSENVSHASHPSHASPPVQSLIAKQKATPSARRPACSCELKPLPVRRTGLSGIPLGKFSGPLSEAHAAVNQRALCAGGE